ncbi:MAG: cell division protein FtsZ [Gammaproteobacteria bacterium]|nr:cell division protein FtsZ [Gammaproteobacteria bacterium]
MFSTDSKNTHGAVIRVIGVGGGGGNAVKSMLDSHLEGVEFACANTDAQALLDCHTHVIQLGDQITKGLGAGADPAIGRQAAEEDSERIREFLADTDLVFITAGMGGGTGTGAAPVIARLAKEMGILTVAVVTRPFVFEGKQRAQIAEEGIQQLYPNVDSLIIIPNNKLLSVLGKNMTLLNAFKAANNVLLGAVQGISELITRPGLINVDFADVRTVMSANGMAMMGTGVGTGDNRARQAAEAAISSPLLEDVHLQGAKGVLVNITAGLDMSIGEFEEVGEAVKDFTCENATVVVGTVIDPNMKDEMRVTLVVTGLGDRESSDARGHVNTGANATMNYYQHLRNDGSVDYHRLDRPAVLRQKAAAFNNAHTTNSVTTSTIRKPVNAPVVPPAEPQKRNAADYLDIPAFLRRPEEVE